MRKFHVKKGDEVVVIAGTEKGKRGRIIEVLRGQEGAIDDAAKDLALITGRKPVISKSRHSIANFKLREGQPIGCRVTLRREAMYEFFDRLVAVTLPRIRDFRGLSIRSFDGRGNYSLGIADQTVFPEI